VNIHVGAIAKPTKKSAAASEVKNKFEIVLNDSFLAINHKTTAFPIMAAKATRPYHVDKMIFAVMLSSINSLWQVLLIFSGSCALLNFIL